jgi:hypothetical protein
LKTQLARGRAHALERSEVVPPAANDMRRMLLVGRDRWAVSRSANNPRW